MRVRLIMTNCVFQIIMINGDKFGKRSYTLNFQVRGERY